MRRSEFIKIISGGVLLLATGKSANATTKSVTRRGRRGLRFGVVTDIHYSDRPISGTRFYRESCIKIREAIEHFNRSDLDFIIELGDMKDMLRPDKDPARTLRDLDVIEGYFRKFDGATYHALGNHDMDCISKSEFLSHTHNTGRAKGQAYYSFAARGVRCIVLDANYNPDGTHYCRGNFSWKHTLVPDEQLRWLDKELARYSNQPTLIFLHQLLDNFSGLSKSVYVGNADAVREVLERHPQVMAVFQGHHHAGHYSNRAGIHYVTLQAMIEKAAAKHNSYAVIEMMPDGTIKIEGFKDCVSRELQPL